jgi:benzodiazapine receptor
VVENGGAGQMRIPVDNATSYRGRNSRPNLPVLGLLIAIALAVELLSYVFSPAASSAAAHWYAALAKPDWLPPQGWFGPVWTVLYVSMGASLWLVWRERYHRARTTALTAYALQLCLNALWSPLFFGLHDIGTGLFVSVALWISIVWTMREFARIRPPAAIIMLPYLVWVSIAAAMNLSLWKLNP